VDVVVGLGVVVDVVVGVGVVVDVVVVVVQLPLTALVEKMRPVVKVFLFRDGHE
jgi:hypothetical protein